MNKNWNSDTHIIIDDKNMKQNVYNEQTWLDPS